MVLVDTSIWIDHFRNDNKELKGLLLKAKVICHPFIIGELACGNLNNREGILSLMRSLPRAKVAEQEEILKFIKANHLMGIGIGYIDVNLLASSLLSEVLLWTFDKRLQKAAIQLHVSYK